VQQPSDRQLLRDFAAGSPAAFEDLTRRYSGVVLGVCERLMPDAAGADDAAQAAFLALARKSRSLSDSASCAGWLHHVTCHVARRAKCLTHGPEAHASRPDGDWGRVAPVIDSELDALPEKYRVALILQNLLELTREDAARLAGCSPELISARLDRGRELLRDRLARRGVVLSVGILAMLLSKHGTAKVVPDGFVSATAKAARLTFERKPAASDQVMALVRSVSHHLLLARLKVAGAVVLAGCLIGGFAVDLFTASSSKGVVAQSPEKFSDGYVPPEPPAPPPTVILKPDPPSPPAERVPSIPETKPEPPGTPPAPVVVVVPVPIEKPADPPPGPLTPRPVKAGITLSMQPVKRILGSGETPVFTFNYKNVTDKAVSLSGGGSSAMQISVESIDGEKASWRFDGNKAFSARAIETALTPGQSCSQKVPLFGRFLGNSNDPNRPLGSLPSGKYRLTARVRFVPPRHAAAADTPEFWDGDVEASAEFEVAAERTASLDR
jgi:DNA-directed RNA polymerase specialized sigma24 family protein